EQGAEAMAEVKHSVAEKGVPGEKTHNRWEERRRKTVILNGMFKPDYLSIMQTLLQFKLIEDEKVVDQIHVRYVANKPWAFVLMLTEEAATTALSRNSNLKDSGLVLWKDLSREARLKLKSERGNFL